MLKKICLQERSKLFILSFPTNDWRWWTVVTNSFMLSKIVHLEMTENSLFLPSSSSYFTCFIPKIINHYECMKSAALKLGQQWLSSLSQSFNFPFPWHLFLHFHSVHLQLHASHIIYSYITTFLTTSLLSFSLLHNINYNKSLSSQLEASFLFRSSSPKNSRNTLHFTLTNALLSFIESTFQSRFLYQGLCVYYIYKSPPSRFLKQDFHV